VRKNQGSLNFFYFFYTFSFFALQSTHNNLSTRAKKGKGVIFLSFSGSPQYFSDIFGNLNDLPLYLHHLLSFRRKIRASEEAHHAKVSLSENLATFVKPKEIPSAFLCLKRSFSSLALPYSWKCPTFTPTFAK
jgi:hypothetical protein